MRSWVESEERSVEIPRTQRLIARPALQTVIETVAAVLEVGPSEIATQRGGLPRMLIALLASCEGLIILREIAKSLTLRSSGHISNLVRRCAAEITTNRYVAAKARQCLIRLRLASLALG